MKAETDLFEFTERFPNEAACIEFLEKSRWAEGSIKSPFTEGEAYRIKTRPGIYKCKETRQTFSVRQGTIFEESRLGLRKWFFAIFLVISLKKGISSVQIAKTIGVTQKTAWCMLHRIRYAVQHEEFSKPLDRFREIDEHNPGGRGPGGKRGRVAASKTPIVGMVERGGEVRAEAVSDCKIATLAPMICHNKHTTSDFGRFIDWFRTCDGHLTCKALIA